ncbi:GAF domain-containing sensor histidine kinase [Paenibacillus sp. Marseille-Q4541]|uniref:GAF domain-containing sensor histidine kinase n=1 Tax=Paenibacillus sp. Marseille-Q4541 TaxID=2831522 RepID=UPI001BA943FB|nr:GAF domain-containing sensor histidine kinase [Paenibacillus sp. Marseille-Q4541]
MSQDHHREELLILKTIAETLNTSNDLKPMLHHVLGKLMELTGLTSSWIFLNEDTEYEFVADYNLPPGLTYNNKAPMCGSSCWCLNSYRSKKLKGAVNILECQRLEKAVDQGEGDTWNISHHATVPLRSGQRSFGLMNVAAPDKNHFSEEELALLESVALQIGSTIERTRLYALEQRRAERFASVGELVNQLSAVMEQQVVTEEEVIHAVLELIHTHFDWPYAIWLEGEKTELLQACIHNKGMTPKVITLSMLPESDKKSRENRCFQSQDSFQMMKPEDVPAPLRTLADMDTDIQSNVTWIASKVSTCANNENNYALLIASTSKETLRPADGEALDALLDAVMSARARVFLDEQRKELARLAERNRLARDLHDSVNQMLFSLSVTAKGVERLLQNNQKEAALPYITDMQQLSQDALSEMRSLILQLRPSELNKGIGLALKCYGENLGLNMMLQNTLHGVLTEDMEETLFRIGQEALNNVSKHANAMLTKIKIYKKDDKITLIIEDNGQGSRLEAGELDRIAWKGSIGLASMRERAEMAGGELVWRSESGKGTTVTVVLPQHVSFIN